MEPGTAAGISGVPSHGSWSRLGGRVDGGMEVREVRACWPCPSSPPFLLFSLEPQQAMEELSRHRRPSDSCRSRPSSTRSCCHPPDPQQPRRSPQLGHHRSLEMPPPPRVDRVAHLHSGIFRYRIVFSFPWIRKRCTGVDAGRAERLVRQSFRPPR